MQQTVIRDVPETRVRLADERVSPAYCHKIVTRYVAGDPSVAKRTKTYMLDDTEELQESYLSTYA